MKTYHIRRDEKNRVLVDVSVIYDTPHVPEMELISPSPYRMAESYPLKDMGDEGFEYGFTGAGPRHLAHCILADYLGETELTHVEFLDRNGLPFLSRMVRHFFRDGVIAAMNTDVREHYLLEANIEAWFMREYPLINLTEYKKRREEYREALKTYVDLLDELEGENFVEDFEEKNRAWNKAGETMREFQDWIDSITERTTEN